MARIFVCNDCKKQPEVHKLCSDSPVSLAGFLLYCAKCKLEELEDDSPIAKEMVRDIKKINGNWIKLDKWWNS